MKVYGLSLLWLLFCTQVHGQTNNATAPPDSVKIKSEMKDLERIRQQLTERIQKLKIACREDSIGIVNLKNKRKDVTVQSDALKAGITDLEKKKTKTREERKLLKDLKNGHAEISAKLVGMNQELDTIEINYKESMDLLANAEKMTRELTQQLRELRRLLNP